MSVLETLARTAGQADIQSQQRVAYATGAWSNLMESQVYKAAGNELLKMMETKPDEITAKDVMGLAQKYKLNDESMQKLMQKLDQSGAMEAAMATRKNMIAQQEAQKALTQKTGLPHENAGKLMEISAAAEAKPDTPTKLQEAGMTEMGGLVVGYNPETNELVVNDKGTQRPYDSAKDGKVLSKNLSQGVVIKLAQEKQMATDISQDALKLAASQYLTTGIMPALGMGNANLRMRVLNEAGNIAKSMGADPMKIPALQAEFNAQKKALGSLTTATANFGAFESGMLKNADYASTLSKEFPRSRIPPWNTVVNAIKTKTGDPKIVRFSNALYAAALEYEKIRTAGTSISSAELSVEAQRKAEELINTSQTHEQLVAGFDAMKVDARNIMSARRQAIKDTQNALSVFDGGTNAAGAGRTIVEQRKTKSGKILVKYSDGTIEEKK